MARGKIVNGMNLDKLELYIPAGAGQNVAYPKIVGPKNW